jgi:hypothetical protein
LKEQSKNRADWEKSIKEARVCVGVPSSKRQKMKKNKKKKKEKRRRRRKRRKRRRRRRRIRGKRWRGGEDFFVLNISAFLANCTVPHPR